MSTTHRRGPWSQQEDSYLCSLVSTQGALNWVRIAQLISTRSPKQCRERYHQNLKPSLNHEPISPEEGLLIERLVVEMGKRWAEIARRLNGRSDNAVKNWWNGSMNRRKRVVLRRRISTHGQNNFDERTQTLSFPRQSNNRQLTIANPNNYPSMRGMDGPLLSPAESHGSRAESVDRAPSLMSDNGSAFSISPRVASTPRLELPHPNSFNRDARRPSLPQLRFHSEADSHLQSRFPSDTKAHGVSILPLTNFRPSHYPPLSPRNHPYDQRSHTAPNTPSVTLPPLQFINGNNQSYPAPFQMQRENSQSTLLPALRNAESQRPPSTSGEKVQKDLRMDLNSLLD